MKRVSIRILCYTIDCVSFKHVIKPKQDRDQAHYKYISIQKIKKSNFSSKIKLNL